MGDTAVVTGAAGDLGGSFARGLAADGWSVVLADHPSAAARLEQAAGTVPGSTTATFDVTDAAAVEAAFAALETPPVAVVANAGVQGAFRPVHEYDLDDARRVLDVNVMGVFTVVAAAARAMIAAGVPGSIVVTASMAGVSGAPNMPAYSASKAALIGLTKAVAKDLAPHGIRVNSISPAFIGPGAMWDNQVRAQAAAGSQYFATDPEAVAEQMIGMIPLRRYGSPDEVADVVRWLLGPQSSYVVGQNIEISGGSV